MCGPVVRHAVLHISEMYLLFYHINLLSQASIAARTLILMQGSVEKELKNAVRIELDNCQTRATISTPQSRHCRVVQLLYLTRNNRKKR